MANKFEFISHVRVSGKDGIGYRETPYVRLRNGEEPPIMIQGGQYFDGGGRLVGEDDVPAWVKDEVRKMTPDVREEVGLPRRMAGKPHESMAK